MRQISLKRLLAKKEVRHVIDRIISAINTPMGIQDLEGKLLLGSPVEAPEQRHSIRLDDRTIGWNLTSKLALRNAKGEVVGTAGISRDFEKLHWENPTFQALAQVVEYVRQHYDQPITIPSLAKLTGLSASQFRRNFQRYFQMRPLQFVNRVRLASACDALATSTQPIGDIAVAAGFYDHSHFTRLFTRTMGMSPRRYRNRYGIYREAED